MRPAIVTFGMMCAAVLAVASVVQAVNSWLDIQLAAPALLALSIVVLLATAIVRDTPKKGEG